MRNIGIPPRLCPACGAILVRRAGERPAYFRDRRYCGWECSVRGRSQAKDARLAEDQQVEPVDSFDRAFLLRTAHGAAPQVPVSILADVLDALEPLITSNARRAVLAHVGAHVRAAREA